MKSRRILLFLILAVSALLLTSCSADWGEEVVYVRLSNGDSTMDWIVDKNGDLMKPAADLGGEEFDFSGCKTGDVIRMEIYLIQEIFPANVVYKRCEATGRTAEVKMKDEYRSWLAENEMYEGVWTIAE
ncbi:MAG: hypothetical protein IJC71_03945 [Clostridia bacterium]|nr:hypothetical protein [Clostridia bacterium]